MDQAAIEMQEQPLRRLVKADEHEVLSPETKYAESHKKATKKSERLTNTTTSTYSKL